MTVLAGPPDTAAARLDADALLELSRRVDPVGVLSIYVDARPGEGLRAAAIEIANRLAELQQRLGDQDPDGRAVLDEIVQLAPKIEQLTDPDQPGRGRVLFAAVRDAWTIQVPAQLPLPNRVVLDRSPFIHPLLELLDEGRPAGVVLASRSHARLLEWRLGALVPLRWLTAEVVAPSHERAGPIGSRPGKRHGTPTGEQRQARDREQAARFIDHVAAVASRLAGEHGWERLLVSGGEQLTDPLVRALPAAQRQLAVRDPRVLVSLPIGMLSELVSDRLRAAHDSYEQRLIDTVREQGPGGDRTALGPSQVVAALNQARVAHLIYDPDIRYHGSVGQDGALYAGDEAPAGVTAPEPRLTERIVERALEIDARVTPIEGAAAGLAHASGIAALLRW